MGQAKVARAAGLTNRDLGTNYWVVGVDLNGKSNAQLNSTSSTQRFVRTKTETNGTAAYETKYPNNKSKAGWVANVSPKNQ